MNAIISKIQTRLSQRYGIKVAPALEAEAVSRIYILPTRYGLLFIPVLLGMLIGAINYNNNMAFLLTFLLASMAVINLLRTHATLAGLTISAIHITPVFAGETATVALWYTSARPTPAFFEGRLLRARSAPLPAPAPDRIVALLPTQRRGRLQPGKLKIWTTFPGGLFKAWGNIMVRTAALVYPRPIAGPPESGPLFDDAAGGTTDTHQPGSDDFYELRVWRPGDPRQHIAWKTSARVSQYLTKTFQQQQDRSALLFDYHQLRLSGAETRLSRLCGLVLWAHQHQCTYGLRLPDRMIPPGQGGLHRQRCLQALAYCDVHDEADGST